VLASGRSNNELDSNKLSSKYVVSPIKDAVVKVLENWKSK